LTSNPSADGTTGPAPTVHDGPRFAWWEPVLIGVACLLIGAPSLRTNPVGNHDVAVIASTSERMLHGDRLYSEVPHPSPPLTYMAEMIPVAVARAFGWDAMTVMQVAILALAAACLWVLARASAACRVPEGSWARVAWLLLCAGAVFGYKNYEIGQRDPMWVVATLPYLVGAAGAAVGRPLTGRLATGVGVLGALGVLIKPHFVLLPLVVEALLVVETKTAKTLLRRDAIALWSIVFGFSLWMLLVTHSVAALRAYREGFVPYGKLGY